MDDTNQSDVDPAQPPDDSAVADDPGQEDGAADTDTIRIERDKFKDLAYRAAAELENYKRRAAREREEVAASAKERFVSRMIPILDAFDLAEAAAGSGLAEDDRKKYIDGFLAIRRQMMTSLESLGLAVITLPPDADFHPGEQEAVFTEEVDGLNTPIVLAALQKGYTLDGRLIRPVRVKVGMPKPAGSSARADENKRGEDK